jgi:hypothetical protein
MERYLLFYVNVFEELHLEHKQPMTRFSLMYGINYFTEDEITKIIILSKISNQKKINAKKTYRRIKTKIDNLSKGFDNNIKQKA